MMLSGSPAVGPAANSANFSLLGHGELGRVRVVAAVPVYGDGDVVAAG